MQKGYVWNVGRYWAVRFYESVVEDGRVVRRQKTKKLVLTPELITKEKSERAAAEVLAAAVLAPYNAMTVQPESRTKLTHFLQHEYLPYIEKNKKPSTYRSAFGMWQLLHNHVNGMELRDVRTSDIDDLLKAATVDKQRAHTTHRNMRNFLSGAFRYAIRRNMVDRNPVRDAEIPRGLPAHEKEAYSLKEIQAMLRALPEPAKTFITVLSFTGLRLSEAKGLRWEDFRDDGLHIERSVWQGHIGDTKTLTSKAAVPVVSIVAKALKAHRKRVPGLGYIFTGERTQNPLRVENELRRHWRAILDKRGIPWKGWHAFRRGLATNLNALGVDPKTIQAILRHSQLSTTMSIYVQVPTRATQAAMRKLEKAYRSK